MSMALIDLILNVAGLILWFNWRAARGDSLARTTGITSRPTPSSVLVRWVLAGVLVGLICGRAIFYRLLGPEVEWTANLDLGAITLFFRADQLWLMMLYSALSFVRALVLGYSWLLAVSIINRNSPATDSISRLVRGQLGSIVGWPTCVQLALPLAFAAAAWPALHALLSYVKVAGPLPAFAPLMLQSCLIGLGIYLSLKFLIPALLLADLLARYIYFGRSPFWDFLNTTARNILFPLQRLPLRIGKVDFAPLAGIALTLLLLHALPRLLLHELHKRNLALWPQ
jgi:uncharacterized protein YggT (Ycf19 family)